MKTSVAKNNAPASACRLAGGAVTFEAADDGKSIPVRMMARSPLPIEHFWWGRVVHDMTGMQLHKETLPCDYEHGEPIGYLNKFTASNEGLFVEGALVPTNEPGDRVRRLQQLAAGGVPYEASIFFGGDGIKCEWLGEGQVADVNGYTFEGPGCIVREWPLRGVAVCPYGADMNTSSAFASAGDEVYSLSNLEHGMRKGMNPKATKFDADDEDKKKPSDEQSEGEDQKDEQDGGDDNDEADGEDEDKEADADEEEDKASKKQSRKPGNQRLSREREEAARFFKAFGEKGAVWFAQGLSFSDCQANQIAELSSRLSAMETKLKAGDKATGEKKPLGFNAGDGKERKGFASKLKFAGATPK